MQCLYLEVLNPQHYDFTHEWLVDVVFESAAAVLVCWAKVIQSGIRRRALSSSRAAVRGASEASKQASKQTNARRPNSPRRPRNPHYRPSNRAHVQEAPASFHYWALLSPDGSPQAGREITLHLAQGVSQPLFSSPVILKFLARTCHINTHLYKQLDSPCLQCLQSYNPFYALQEQSHSHINTREGETIRKYT